MIRDYDSARHDEAAAVQRDHPSWLITYGPYSRLFFAFPMFRIPRGVTFAGREPADLLAAMRSTELSASSSQPPPARPGQRCLRLCRDKSPSEHPPWHDQRMLNAKLLAVPALAATLALAGCGGSVHAPAPPTAAQCSRAQAAALSASDVAGYYTDVTSRQGLMSADMSVAADPSVTGSEASELDDIRAAGTGAAGSLARPLARLGASYRALEADIAAQAAPAAAEDSSAADADAGDISAVCARI